MCHLVVILDLAKSWDLAQSILWGLHWDFFPHHWCGLCYISSSTLNGRQGPGQRENVLNSAKDVESHLGDFSAPRYLPSFSSPSSDLEPPKWGQRRKLVASEAKVIM